VRIDNSRHCPHEKLLFLLNSGVKVYLRSLNGSYLCVNRSLWNSALCCVGAPWDAGTFKISKSPDGFFTSNLPRTFDKFSVEVGENGKFYFKSLEIGKM
jgi:hypothetical protein